jgi:hypothetical protein
MQLVQIINIEKKDVPLYYRNEYTAVSEFLLIGNTSVSIPIYFSIEMAPTGEKSIDVKLNKAVDYPIIPLLKALKTEIKDLEQKGKFL